jgi:2-methylcitrate dehydratase PrpD
VLFDDKPFRFQRPFGSYVMENTLFKIPYPTAFHGQTGVEAAIQLYPLVKDRLNDIKKVEIRAHNSTMVILDKTGPLHNFADRDHCMRYMMAIGLIYGTMTAEHYHDHFAADPRIDQLRAKMNMQESKQYEREYHDPKKRTNANSIQVFFKDGSKTPLSEVLYPLGHRKRRQEGVPVLMKKLEGAVGRVFAPKQRDLIVSACLDQKKLEALPVHRFMDLLVP